MNLVVPLSRFLFILGIIFFPALSWAIPSMMPKLADRELRLGLLGSIYVSKPNQAIADQATGNLGLALDGRGVGNKDYLHYGIEAEALYGLRHMNSRYLNIDELYLGLEKKENSSRPFVYLGRKRFEWSDLDSYWSMGLFQPRFRWDYLSEKESGLLGLFLGFQSDYVETHAYFSPIFVPEQGAPFDIRNGACHTSSPWFTCPNSTVLVFAQPTNVSFNLDMPPMKNIIMHNGAGASIRLGRYKGPFSRFSYTHKPMNQLMLAFEGRLNLTNNSIPATIHPRVVYHDLYALDAGLQDTRHAAVFSMIKEKPKRDFTPSNWNTQESSDATILGGTIRSHPVRQWEETRIEFSYQHRDGGVAPDRGPFASSGVDFFEPRYSFQNAFSFAVFTPFSDDWAKDFLFGLKFIDDTANEGNLLVMDSFYYPWTQLILNLGVDLLGSRATSPVDFLARYQKNNRIRGGVSYVF